MSQEDLENNLRALMALKKPDGTPVWPSYATVYDKKLKTDNLAITHM